MRLRDVLVAEDVAAISRHVRMARAQILSGAFRWSAHAQARVSSSAGRRRKRELLRSPAT